MREGWIYGTLDDVVKKASSNISLNKIKDEDGIYPVYGAKGFVQNVSFFQQEEEYLGIIKDGAGIGRVSKHPAKSSIVATMQYLIPKEDFDIDFIRYFLLGIDFQSHRTGSTIPHIYFKDYKSEKFPLVTIKEQTQIVTTLDKAFNQIDQAKANLEKNLNNAKELWESYLVGKFEKKDETWIEKKWGEVCHFVRGPFGGSLKKSMFKEEGYVVYEQKHAIHDHFNQLRYFINEDKFNEMKRFEVKEGDIIMSCSGVTLGRVAVIPNNIPRGIINQALLKLTPNQDIDVEFLKYWMRSKIFQDIIFKHSGGAAIPNVPSAKILKDIKLFLPDRQEQEKIIIEIKFMYEKNQELQTHYQQKLNNLEELKKSILQKAFRGELVYQ